MLTSNIEIERKDKIRQGRVHVIRKMYPGFVEEENCLLALDVLADLNEALKSVKQVLFSSTEGRKMNTKVGLHHPPPPQTFRALPEGLGR